jgi:hypothetical protein
MTPTKWVTLSDSIAGKTRRFICVFPGYDPMYDPKETIDTSLEGALDVQRGGVYKVFQYVFRVRVDEVNPDYGSQADLEYFYLLKNPRGTPSDVLTLTDHYGNIWSVLLTGQYNPQAQTVYLDGPYAFALIPVTLRKTTAMEPIEDSGS